MLILLLFIFSLTAMENDGEFILEYGNFPIARTVESSAYGWRSPLSHVENRLSPVVPINMVTRGEIALPYIPYGDARERVFYYAHMKPYHYGPAHDHNDTCYWVTNNRGDAIPLPFQPRHLALNATKTIMLIEGWGAMIAHENGEIAIPINNELVAYSLATRKIYQLHDYKALYGHKTSVIGFKEGSSATAMADFALSHQEWDLSGIEQ